MDYEDDDGGREIPLLASIWCQAGGWVDVDGLVGTRNERKER